MHAILHNVSQKIKGYELFIILGSIIGLLCVASFALGYIYRSYSQKAVLSSNDLIRVEYPPYVTDMMQQGSYAILTNGSSSKTAQIAQKQVNEGEVDIALQEQLKATAGSFAASLNGSVYYPINCGALSRVQSENRIYFSSSAEAETLGYTLSKSCD